MGKALELIFPAAGGAKGLERFALVLAAALTGNPQLLAVAISTSVSQIFAPEIPKPEAGQTTAQQTVPPRVSGYGVSGKLGGSYMLFESVANDSFDVVALCDGDGLNPAVTEFLKFYLNDDLVTLGGSSFGVNGHYVSDVPSNDDGRYETQVAIDFHYGEVTETAFALTKSVGGDAVLTDIWGANCRGDGIASLLLRCQHGKQQFIPTYYPNGLPRPAAVAKLLKVYDWRLDSTAGGAGSQRLDTPSTWQWSDNPILCLAHYECFHPHGPLEDFSTRITPQLAAWSEAANVCDELVPLKAGGTEKRYRCGGTFIYENARGDVKAKILETCDGYTADAADGSLVVYAGKYYAPSVTLTKDDIKGLLWSRFLPDEEVVNELSVSFTDPASEYVEVKITPWRDEDDIDERGEVRSTSFYPTWVQSKGQASRLAKRAMGRQKATVRGTVRCFLSGLQVVSERYVRLQYGAGVLADIPVEIASPPKTDFATLSVTFDFIAADVDIDAWNAATEEGDANTAPRPVGTRLSQPTIDEVVVFTQATAGGSLGTRLRITATGPNRTDLQWFHSWMVHGAVAWTEGARLDAGDTATVTWETEFVPADADLDVRVAYTTGGDSISDWSDTESVDTSPAAAAPLPPSGVAAVGGSGQVATSWSNPTSSNFHGSRVWIGGPADVFGDAVDASGLLVGTAGAAESYTATGLTAGSYRVWVTAESDVPLQSTPTGPLAATVT